MSFIPSVLFATCTNEPLSSLIKLILGELPDATEPEKGILCYPWHVNTKYYEADIQLCAMQSKIVSTPGFANSVQGAILHFDGEQPNCLKLIDEWLVLIKEYQPEVKILVCSQCKDKPSKGISKHEIQKWCIKEEFELVELEPENDEWDSEQDFPEANGIKRIRQALEAHVWPNLSLKERREPTSMASLLHGGICKSTESAFESMSYTAGADNIEPTLDELCDKENVNFCELFSQLASMKERASNMPSEERKAFAEQLVLAYWNALGGDEDQILDC